jgi:hypothetical protein
MGRHRQGNITVRATTYIATVEVDTRHHHGHEEVADTLAPYEPVFGRSSRGWVEVQLRVEATGLAHACATSAAIARVATGAESLACHVMTEQEWIGRRRPAARVSGPAGPTRSGPAAS